MKIASKIAGFLMSCLTLCTAMQPVAAMAENTEMARPRSTIDLSRTDRLTGTPYGKDAAPYDCPSGQVLSGGVCVLISNQSTGVPSWTSYFLGQKKCSSTIAPFLHTGVSGCAAILGDGRIQFSVDLTGVANPGPTTYSYADVPYQMAGVAFSKINGADVVGISAGPIVTSDQRLHGTAPTDWFVQTSSVDTSVDGGSRP